MSCKSTTFCCYDLIKKSRILTGIEATKVLDNGASSSQNAVKPTDNDSLELTDLSLSLKALDLDKKNEKSSVEVIDTEAGMQDFVESLSDLPTIPPSLYIDIEGVNLCRHGMISIIQVYVLPHDRTYLIDVFTLRDNAFVHMPSKKGTTFKDILESSDIPKVIFDVRTDSDALYGLYNIHLSGAQDLQLMELATRPGRREFVSGLQNCIRNDASLTYEERTKWANSKQTGRSLFAPECGGSYEVFNERPIQERIIQYCAQDVQFLPMLWKVYDSKLRWPWHERVKRETASRIHCSKSPDYVSKGRHLALAPPDWQ